MHNTRKCTAMHNCTSHFTCKRTIWKNRNHRSLYILMMLISLTNPQWTCRRQQKVALLWRNLHWWASWSIYLVLTTAKGMNNVVQVFLVTGSKVIAVVWFGCLYHHISSLTNYFHSPHYLSKLTLLTMPRNNPLDETCFGIKPSHL